MKKILFLSLITCLSLATQAQRRYEDVLRQVESTNPVLQTARQQRDARQLEAHVGLMLPDPHVELALFRGDPVDKGTRWDLRVNQSFEMPSVYVRRARLRNLQEHAAELDYETLRNTILHETQLVCAELIYARGVARVYGEFTVTAIKLQRLYEKRLAEGDCSLIDYNRVLMQEAEAENLATLAVLRTGHLIRELCTLMGVEYYDFNIEAFDTVILPLMFDEWYDTVESRNPELRTLQNEVDTRLQELQLSRAKWLPSLSLGYASETVTGEAFRGVTVGMTLPVWSQPRAVKHAKLSHTASQQAYASRRSVTYNESQCLMHHLLALQNDLNNMNRAKRLYNSSELLEKALEAGEITLENYLNQINYYLQQDIAIWDIQYELEKGFIDLYAFTL